MIARDRLHSRPAPRPAHGPVDRWLTWWQTVLTDVADSAVHAGTSAGRLTRRPATRGTGGSGLTAASFTQVRGAALAWYGWVAVAIGAVLGVVLASPGVGQRAAALAGVASLGWALVRSALVRALAPDALADDPALTRGILSLGLLAYAFAVTPELRLAAWAVSAGVTAWLLVRAGARRDQVARAVGLAWGVQALVVLGGWLAKNVLLGILTTFG